MHSYYTSSSLFIVDISLFSINFNNFNTTFILLHHASSHFIMLHSNFIMQIAKFHGDKIFSTIIHVSFRNHQQHYEKLF